MQFGGAVHIYGGIATFDRCVFSRNEAVGYGSWQLGGGAVLIERGSATFIATTFASTNKATLGRDLFLDNTQNHAPVVVLRNMPSKALDIHFQPSGKLPSTNFVSKGVELQNCTHVAACPSNFTCTDRANKGTEWGVDCTNTTGLSNRLFVL